MDLRTLEADCGVVLKKFNNGAMENTDTLTHVYLPDSVETLVGNTFQLSDALEFVDFGNGITEICTSACGNCKVLKKVILPKNLKKIRTSAFDGCSELVLTPADIPQSVTSIGYRAFKNCKKFTGDLVLPNFTDTMGKDGYQFEGTSITSFSAPNLNLIPNGIFCNNGKIVSATFSTAVTNIGEYAFHNASSLEKIYPTEFPHVQSIGYSAFRGCKKLDVSFDFSKSHLTIVPTYALVDLLKVKSIKLPKTLVQLNSESLAYCPASRAIWFMGPPPTTIGNSALYPSSGGTWLLIGGCEFADEWKKSENVIPLGDGDAAKALKLAADLGVTGVKPIGKWTYQTSGYTHWVMEELPKATVILVF
ncbi:MAG: leucine-rich repeat protein [Kiritimatiellae bacterium]|nr:leucine-rich repeat protein [Kiritimatiellia bacterium]